MVLQSPVVHHHPIDLKESWINHQNARFIVNLQSIVITVCLLLINEVEQATNRLRNDFYFLDVDSALWIDSIFASEFVSQLNLN